MLFEEATKKSVEAHSEENTQSGAVSGVTPVSPVTTGERTTGEGTKKDAPAAPARKPRGFAAMDRRLVSLIASKGGKAAHKAGTAHEFTSEEARAAGAKGGAHPAHLKAREADGLHAASTTSSVGNDVSPAPADESATGEGSSR